jgi:hypothetical protein
MIRMLVEAAEGRWRKLIGAHVVALVRVGERVENGELEEGCEEEAAA